MMCNSAVSFQRLMNLMLADLNYEDFAKTTKQLHTLTSNIDRFQWTPECQTPLEELKNKMVNAPVITFPLDDDMYYWSIAAIPVKRDPEK